MESRNRSPTREENEESLEESLECGPSPDSSLVVEEPSTSGLNVTQTVESMQQSRMVDEGILDEKNLSGVGIHPPTSGTNAENEVQGNLKPETRRDGSSPGRNEHVKQPADSSSELNKIRHPVHDNTKQSPQMPVLEDDREALKRNDSMDVSVGPQEVPPSPNAQNRSSARDMPEKSQVLPGWVGRTLSDIKRATESATNPLPSRPSPGQSLTPGSDGFSVKDGGNELTGPLGSRFTDSPLEPRSPIPVQPDPNNADVDALKSDVPEPNVEPTLVDTEGRTGDVEPPARTIESHPIQVQIPAERKKEEPVGWHRILHWFTIWWFVWDLVERFKSRLRPKVSVKKGHDDEVESGLEGTLFETPDKPTSVVPPTGDDEDYDMEAHRRDRINGQHPIQCSDDEDFVENDVERQNGRETEPIPNPNHVVSNNQHILSWLCLMSFLLYPSRLSNRILDQYLSLLELLQRGSGGPVVERPNISYHGDVFIHNQANRPPMVDDLYCVHCPSLLSPTRPLYICPECRGRLCGECARPDLECPD